MGIGQDFNEDRLMPMAEAGGGNAWHVQESDDMTRIFTVELNGLIGQIGKNVTLRVKTRDGARVVDLLNDFETDRAGDHKLPNLQAGSPLDIVIRLQVGPGKLSDKLDAAEFSIRYTAISIKVLFGLLKPGPKSNVLLKTPLIGTVFGFDKTWPRGLPPVTASKSRHVRSQRPFAGLVPSLRRP